MKAERQQLDTQMDKVTLEKQGSVTRRDFLRLGTALALAATASACANVKDGNPLEPTLVSTSESPAQVATPFPEGVYIATGETHLNRVVDLQVIADEIKGFESSEVDFYDEQGNLQVEKDGKKSGFTLLAILDAQIDGSLPASTFGYVTSAGGREHIAQKIDDGRWVVLGFRELPEPNGNVLRAFGYTSQGIFLPILSVEFSPSGEPTSNEWFYDISVNRFYTISDPEGKGVNGMLSLIQVGNENILKGKSLMRGDIEKNWNFAWNDNGNLTIAGEDGRTLYTYDGENKQWVLEKQYKVCGLEDYNDCPIPVEDLYNGDYLRWLKTLSKPFDPSKVEDTTIINLGDKFLYVSITNNPETVPVRRGVTAGGLVIQEGEFGYEFWGERKFVVLPIELFDKEHPDENIWLITVMPNAKKSDGEMRSRLKSWESSSSFGFFTNPYYSGLKDSPGNSQNPLVQRTFELHPDIQDRFDDFSNTGVPTLLSQPGIVLETVRVTN